MTRVLWLGFLSLIGSLFLPVGEARAAQLTATVDRQAVTQDDSVTLKLSVQLDDGSSGSVIPQFQAKDFEVINSFESSFTQSVYANGQFQVTRNQDVTKVLRPLKAGKLKISQIQVSVNGKKLTAPDIVIQVSPSGTVIPSNQGGGGLAQGGSQAGGGEFFLRAETSKSKLYKGEQLIVSYYLYRRVQVFNIEVKKYPVLKGFLREDLSLPVLGRRLDSESVTLGGISYYRSLLARYAAYPLQDGKLQIDPMEIKADSYPPNQRGGGSNNPNDPFNDPFFNFFKRMAPRPSQKSSPVLEVEVSALPSEGRPQGFSGGVGSFKISAAVDKEAAKVNDPITLTIKVEGRGNVASIQLPEPQWPSQFELYEASNKAKTTSSGIGQKVFEYLLIPRQPGELTLPSVTLHTFDPDQKEYVAQKTDEFKVSVTGKPSSIPLPSSPAGASGDVNSKQAVDIRYLLPSSLEGDRFLGYPWWRWVYWVAIASILILILFVGLDQILKGKRSLRVQRQKQDQTRRGTEQLWLDLQKKARQSEATGTWEEILDLYEQMVKTLLDSIETCFGQNVRSFSRSELKEFLLDQKNVQSSLWVKIEKILDDVDALRYASSGAIISEKSARSDLIRWIQEAEKITRSFLEVKK